MTKNEAIRELGILGDKPISEALRILANSASTEAGAIGLPRLYNQKEVRDYFGDTIPSQLRAIATLVELG